MVGDYNAAVATADRLQQQQQEALGALGAQAQSLAWFLAGACRLALGEAHDEVAREAFQKSYAHDPAYVDDFLRRHGRGAASCPSPQRPVGGPPLPSAGPRPAAPGGVVCDAHSEAICCFRRDRGKSKSSLS